LNISTVHRFEVTLYKLPVYACLIHSSLFDLIEDLPSVGQKSKTRGFCMLFALLSLWAGTFIICGFLRS
jgi:hypothetical protein